MRHDAGTFEARCVSSRNLSHKRSFLRQNIYQKNTLSARAEIQVVSNINRYR